MDLLILRTLVFGPEHGQGIARAIQQNSEEVLLVDHGSLYPALQRHVAARITLVPCTEITDARMGHAGAMETALLWAVEP